MSALEKDNRSADIGATQNDDFADRAKDRHDSLLGLLWATALLCRDKTQPVAPDEAAPADVADPVEALTRFADNFAASGQERLDDVIHHHMSVVLRACARDMRESGLWSEAGPQE